MVLALLVYVLGVLTPFRPYRPNASMTDTAKEMEDLQFIADIGALITESLEVEHAASTGVRVTSAQHEGRLHPKTNHLGNIESRLTSGGLIVLVACFRNRNYCRT
jgi:hypothetical protein